MDLFAFLLAMTIWELMSLLIALGLGALIGYFFGRRIIVPALWPFETCSATGKEGAELIQEILALAVAARDAGTLPIDRYEWIHVLLAQCMQHNSLLFQQGNSAFPPGDPASHCRAVEKALQHATDASAAGNPAPLADWDLAISELEHGG
ncbi:MAG: hypothetical protein ACYSX0_16650 [Planctomycetota bacterium]|jgi:hypothetical protein